MRGAMHRLAQVELTREEVLALIGMTRARLAEVERMVMGIAEGEGMDLPRHNALKQLEAQEEMLRDLVMKLEGAQREGA